MGTSFSNLFSRIFCMMRTLHKCEMSRHINPIIEYIIGITLNMQCLLSGLFFFFFNNSWYVILVWWRGFICIYVCVCLSISCLSVFYITKIVPIIFPLRISLVWKNFFLYQTLCITIFHSRCLDFFSQHQLDHCQYCVNIPSIWLRHITSTEMCDDLTSGVFYYRD